MTELVQDHIPQGVIERLPAYLSVLLQLRHDGSSTVSSAQLSELTDVNAAQIRRDLAYFGSFGKRGVGYDIGVLIDRIQRILGSDHVASHRARRCGQPRFGDRGIRRASARGFRSRRCSTTIPRKVGSRIGDLIVRDIGELGRRRETSRTSASASSRSRRMPRRMSPTQLVRCRHPGHPELHARACCRSPTTCRCTTPTPSGSCCTRCTTCREPRLSQARRSVAGGMVVPCCCCCVGRPVTAMRTTIWRHSHENTSVCGPMELGIILVVVLILFGPKRLPQLGKSLGKTMKAIREGVDGAEDDEDSRPTPPPRRRRLPQSRTTSSRT